jgi:tryptophanyl-tRNA synthetase
MSDTTNGIWDQWQADQYHQSSPKLAAWLAAYLPKNDCVIDMGCGNGFYMNELWKKGFSCLGVEGFHLDNFLHDNVVIADLIKPLVLPPGWIGTIVSLEVGEHLPESAEDIFLDNINRHCYKHLIISWALPGQPGIGHINCRPQEYIMEKLNKLGFEFCPMATIDARVHIDDNCDWFRRTLMIFERR